MRAKHIKRKKRIDNSIHSYFSSWYNCNGKYSKNKIHCSCPLCTEKTRNKSKGKHRYTSNINYKPSDRRKIESINSNIKDYLDNNY
jgi:hypothetical protein